MLRIQGKLEIDRGRGLLRISRESAVRLADGTSYVVRYQWPRDRLIVLDAEGNSLMHARAHFHTAFHLPYGETVPDLSIGLKVLRGTRVYHAEGESRLVMEYTGKHRELRLPTMAFIHRDYQSHLDFAVEEQHLLPSFITGYRLFCQRNES